MMNDMINSNDVADASDELTSVSSAEGVWRRCVWNYSGVQLDMFKALSLN